MEPDLAEHAGKKPAVTIGDLHLDLERARSGVQGPGFYAAMWATLASGQSFVGDLVNRRALVDPDKGEGRAYSAVKAVPAGMDPDTHPELWSDQGHGLDPEAVTPFKTFYVDFKRWYEENINDKKDKAPSSKSVAADMRKKGFKVESRGGQTKIYGDIRIFSS